MKIVIISTSDVDGGAAKAAYRLHRGLLSAGHNSKMIVLDKLSNDYTVIVEHNKYIKMLNKFRAFCDSIPVRRYKKRTTSLFSPSWVSNNRIIKAIRDINPDVVHIHWNCGGMMSIRDLKSIDLPIIWSLHDMWLFTGGCHYSAECNKYKEQCGSCLILASRKKHDLSRRKYIAKKNSFSKMNKLVVNGLSSWITDCAKASSLLLERRIVNLPNTIDCSTFKPMPVDSARLLWDFSLNKKLVLFGGLGATSDPRKGYDLLQQSLLRLRNDMNIELVIMGSSKPAVTPELDMRTHYTGLLHDDISIISLLSAVDVLVIPSIQENLSNLIMESMACGTPVVAFDIGGNSDMIFHKQNGYLAKPFLPDDLSYGIEWSIEKEDRSIMLSHNARKKIEDTFDYSVVIPKYILIYKSIIQIK